MTNDTKQFIIDILRSSRGDDHIRAERAFQGMTPAQMQQQHGQSGRTRQDILDGYRRVVARVDAAIAEMEAIR